MTTRARHSGTSPTGRLIRLGLRAVDYYVDTGLCVFCETDQDEKHDDHCDVGEAADETQAARNNVRGRKRR